VVKLALVWRDELGNVVEHLAHSGSVREREANRLARIHSCTNATHAMVTLSACAVAFTRAPRLFVGPRYFVTIACMLIASLLPRASEAIGNISTEQFGNGAREVAPARATEHVREGTKLELLGMVAHVFDALRSGVAVSPRLLRCFVFAV